jgi:hypothetical protein
MLWADFMKLSVLIFSMNEPEKALRLVKSIYQIADEVVLVDSSDSIRFRKLIEGKKSLHLTKLKIYYVHPLGYVEPFRMYGLSKCKNEWVLYLDVDENINDELKNGIIEILNCTKGKYDAFAIARENFLDGKRVYRNYGIKLPKNDFHVRLYKKSKTRYLGIVHESPLINGKPLSSVIKNERILKLNTKYMIIQHHSSSDYLNKFIKCMKLEIFQRRKSYADMKLYVPETLKPIFNLYLKLSRKNLRDELSGFDYKLVEKFYLFMLTKNILDLFLPLNAYFDIKIKIISKLPADLKKLTYEVSQHIIERGGVNNYLGIANVSQMEQFSVRYKNDKTNPLDLLNLLLMEKMIKIPVGDQKKRLDSVYNIIYKYSKVAKSRL